MIDLTPPGAAEATAAAFQAAGASVTAPARSGSAGSITAFWAAMQAAGQQLADQADCQYWPGQPLARPGTED